MLYVALAQGDRVLAYRLGTDGLLPAQSFSSVDLINPRRVVLGDGVLYVALDDRVVSLALASDGSLPAMPTAQTKPIRNADFRDMVLVGQVLYAIAPGVFRIHALALESGQVPAEPISRSGTALTDYISIAAANGFVYAGTPAAVRIDTYIIGVDGSLPDAPELQTPESFVSFPVDLLVRDAMIYVAEIGIRGISAFRIRPNGLPQDEPVSETDSVERYVRILVEGNTLYASAFNAGRIDVYPIDPASGNVASVPDFATWADPAAFPSGMLASDGILYVAQAGLGRVDGYILGSDGNPSEFPSTSTSVVADGFPTDIAIGTFP